MNSISNSLGVLNHQLSTFQIIKLPSKPGNISVKDTRGWHQLLSSQVAPALTTVLFVVLPFASISLTLDF